MEERERERKRKKVKRKRDEENARVSISANDPSELAARVDNDILRQPRHMNHQQRASEQVLGDEIAVRDGLHRVSGDGGETEFGTEEFAVDLEGVAGEGAGSEGEGGDAAVRGRKGKKRGARGQ
jgi:hypothetical protein